ncbi:MAG TPA: haloacid dehalogenase-like hydrolase, partial [Cyclobacteriaceae bacterium]|nr:haloacid dehalogenase-like hydrolase [Cyclobacteriaceae bacterium]
MIQNKIFIIDFDSTFIKAETLDILAQTSMAGDTVLEENISRIRDITTEASNGKIPFSESLEKRIRLLKANKSHFPLVIARLKESISPSFIRNRQFFRDYAGQVYIISTGFKEIIVPIVSEFGIKLENVFANTFLFDEKGNISGFDASNILTKDNGKVGLLRELNLQGDIHVIGDGYADYQIKAAGLANRFYVFTENIERENVLDKADHIAPSLDEVLFEHNILKSLSYPKNRIHVLLLENIHPRAEEILKC